MYIYIYINNKSIRRELSSNVETVSGQVILLEKL